MIEVRADDHVAGVVPVDLREHVGAAAAGDVLLVGIEAGGAQGLQDDAARGEALGGAGGAAGALFGAEVFDEGAHGPARVAESSRPWREYDE